MGRTSGNIGTFIFIMTVTNNGKNKWQLYTLAVGWLCGTSVQTDLDIV
jgi:hypothetical protein